MSDLQKFIIEMPKKGKKFGIVQRYKNEKEAHQAYALLIHMLSNEAGQFWWDGRPYRNANLDIVKYDAAHEAFEVRITCEEDF